MAGVLAATPAQTSNGHHSVHAVSLQTGERRDGCVPASDAGVRHGA
jgi:hypothetical protein